jgi:hypothetical protein
MIGFSRRLPALCTLIGAKVANKPLTTMTKRAAAMIVADLMASSMTPTLQHQAFATACQSLAAMAAINARR